MNRDEGPRNLARRKKARVKLRPHLVVSPQTHAGQTCYVVKDPVTLSYFRLDDRQHFLFGLMDGTRTLEAIRKAYQRRYRPDQLSLEELEHFTRLLVNSGLVQIESPHAGASLFEQSEKQRRQERWERVLQFLNVRIPLVDPDRFLTALLPRLRFVFAPLFLAASAILLLLALGLLVTHWAAFVSQLPDVRDLWSWRNLAGLALLLGAVKVLHEIGHGLCCKAMGGEVHDMGLQFLIFFPALYCDVSDSWLLPSKTQRIAISLAGIFVELLIASVATVGWCVTDPGATLHVIFLGLILVCGINTVVLNANPLMRFDGYYALSDWLEIPNLSTQAARMVRTGVLRWLGMSVPALDPALSRRKKLLAVYAVASYAYRWIVLAALFWLLYQLLEPRKLAVLWFTFVLATLAVLLAWPVVRLARTIYRQGRFPDMKPVRLALAASLVVAVVAVIVFLPLPVNVRGAALLQVEPDQVQRATITDQGGFLKELLVEDGQQVHPGEVLAILSNPELEIKLRLNEADQALRLQQKNALLAQPIEVAGAERVVAGDLQQAEFELKLLAREHAALLEQQARQVLRAPCSGTVLGLCSREDRGKWLERGTELCRIGNAHCLRAVLLVPAEKHELIVAGARAWLCVHGGGASRWSGTVTEIAQVEASSIPPALASRAGGEVATQQDPVARKEQPRQPHYLCVVRLQAVDPILHAGALGQVRVETGAETLWWRIRRFLATSFGMNAL